MLHVCLFIFFLENAEEIESIEFDFLINGQFLRVSLEKHFEQNEISTVSLK